MDRLVPNMTLHSMRIVAMPVWVQLWGLPLDYHVQDVAMDLGNVVGTTMSSDEGDILFSSQLIYLRVKVQIDPRLLLVQNIKIRLDNDVVRTVEYKYERVFRSCASCHKIGHTVKTCSSTNSQINSDFAQVASRTFNRFGTRFICNFTARQAELVWQDWIRAHHTRGSTRIRFNPRLSRHFVFKTLPQDVLLSTNRFEGILHFSDEEYSDDDMVTDDDQDQNPHAENPPALQPPMDLVVAENPVFESVGMDTAATEPPSSELIPDHHSEDSNSSKTHTDPLFCASDSPQNHTNFTPLSNIDNLEGDPDYLLFLQTYV